MFRGCLFSGVESEIIVAEHGKRWKLSQVSQGVSAIAEEFSK
jgi:hypothetical protein